MAKKQKIKKCTICGEEMTVYRTTQKVCHNISCTLALIEQQKAKKRKREHNAHKAVFYGNDRPHQLKLAQVAFNAFIRERDKDLPCISCGTTADVVYCAGHYRTRGGAPHLRFNQFNVNRQCNKHCNLELSGNIGEYRINLIKKFGVEKVEEIESSNTPLKLTVDEVVSIKIYYRKLLKAIKEA